MDAASPPTMADIQLRVRALNDSITDRNAGSVECLEAFLQLLNACVGDVSKRLDAAKKAKQAELANKAEIAKKIRNQIAALTARLHQVEAPVAEDDVIVVSPAAPAKEAALRKLVGKAASPIAGMPPPAPRPVAKRNNQNTPASPDAKRAKVRGVVAKVLAAAAALEAAPVAAPAAAADPPAAAAVRDWLSPPAAAPPQEDSQMTQDIDWDA